MLQATPLRGPDVAGSRPARCWRFSGRRASLRGCVVLLLAHVSAADKLQQDTDTAAVRSGTLLTSEAGSDASTTPFIYASSSSGEVVEDASTAEGAFAYHKPLWPLNGKDILCFIGTIFGLIIAAGGGIGGGGILVPMNMLLLQFRPKHAIALANFTIFGGALANMWFNCRKDQPNGRSIIDWDIIVMMEPSTIAGAVIGSFMAKKLPDFVLTVSMALVLLLLAARTLDKGIRMFNMESAAMLEAAAEGDIKASEELMPLQRPPSSAVNGGTAAQTTRFSRLSTEDLDINNLKLRSSTSSVLSASKGEGSSYGQVPWVKVGILVICQLGTLLLTIMKGGSRGSPVGIKCGSLGFWLLSAAFLPWMLLFLGLFRRILLAENAEKVRRGHEFEEGEIEWNSKRTILYPAVCTLAGVLAGLFGVGGGIVKGPLMLEMGVKPNVAAATAATMIFFTTSATCVSFQVFGTLEPDYGIALFSLGLLSTGVGQYLTDKWMSTAGRQSPPVLSIGLVMTISVLFIGLECVEKIIESKEDPAELLHVSSLCEEG